LGLSLEYLLGSVDFNNQSRWWPEDISMFGMGFQGGLSWRCTPNISLDLNGLVKFGFGEAFRFVKNVYRPLAGGAELGITFMLPY
jgi:hypothetical protein